MKGRRTRLHRGRKIERLTKNDREEGGGERTEG